MPAASVAAAREGTTLALGTYHQSTTCGLTNSSRLPAILRLLCLAWAWRRERDGGWRPGSD